MGEPTKGQGGPFRQEALQAAAAGALGAVTLPRSPTSRALAFGLVVLAGVVLTYLLLGSYARKVQVAGVLVAEGATGRVLAPAAAHVSDLRVTEGQQVRAGDVVAVLSQARDTGMGSTVEQDADRQIAVRRASLESDLQRVDAVARGRGSATKARVDSLAIEQRTVAAQLVVQRERLALAEQEAAQFADLAAARFVSDAQHRTRQVSVLEQRQRLAELTRVAATNRREWLAARADLDEIDALAARERSQIEREIATLDQQRLDVAARSATVVRAPTTGRIASITIAADSRVREGQVLAVVVAEDARLEAEVYVPSRAIGHLRPGLPVTVRFDAYPYQRYGFGDGSVREVAAAALRAEDLAAGGAAIVGQSLRSSEPLYRVRVHLDRQFVTANGQQFKLGPGMSVEASVILESRRLIEWLLEPLLSLRSRL